jgi:hypothetical protein
MTPSMNMPAAPPLSTEPVHLSEPSPRSGQEVTAGRLLRQTISVWRRNIFKFTALLVVTVIPGLMVGVGIPLVLFRQASGRPEFAKLGLVVVLLFVPLMVAALAIQVAALTYGAAQQLAGRPVRFGAMLAAGFRRALPVMVAGFIGLIGCLLGTIVLIVPGIIVGCALSVTVPAVVMEKMGPIAALDRSWDLTDGYRFRFFIAYFVLSLAGFAVNLVVQFAAVFAGRAAPLVILLFMFLYVPLLSLQMLLPAVTYHELRIAKEGIGTEELAKVFE